MPTVALSPGFCRLLAALLIVGSGAIHLRYLANDCPLDLAPDEAHYWQWSKQLDASYYSKGPLTAYLIRGSCELLGDSVFAVRLPAVICGSLLLLGLYVLAARCFGDERLSLMIVLTALTMPALSVSRTLMTIDAPYLCLWTWALVAGHQAFFRRSWWAWPVLGVVVGLGILAKYTMAVWLPSAALFLFISPEHRTILRRPGFWVACSIAGLCCFPIVWWNAQHDWVTFRHVGGQASGKGRILWFGPLKFIAGQFGILLGVWFLLWVAVLIAQRPTRETNPVRRYLWCLSAPMFLVFAAFSVRTEILPNWPVTAYVSGLVLASAWLTEKLSQVSVPRRRLIVCGTTAFCGFGVFLSVFAHDTSRFRPILTLFAGEPTATNPQPLRRIDPTCRMRGWRYMAAAVDGVRADLADGPILAASRWTLASELAFYCDGHPMVYSLGSALWDRQSQFDFWRPNPIRDAREFLGRTFVFVDVGQPPPEIVQAFERIEPTRTIRYEEDGQLIAFWDVTVCRGFRGFSRAPNRQY